MRRRNYPKHTHFAYQIQLHGKLDSVYLTCACGKEELVALWWGSAPPNWDKVQWKALRWSAQLLAESYYDAYHGRPMTVAEGMKWILARREPEPDVSYIQHNGLNLVPRKDEWWCLCPAEPKKNTCGETAFDALRKWKKKFGKKR